MIWVFKDEKMSGKKHFCFELLNESFKEDRLVTNVCVHGQGIVVQGPRIPFRIGPRMSQCISFDLTNEVKSFVLELQVDGVRCIYEVKA